MAKPWIHARSSARRFGGSPEDYIDIHEFLDSSKAIVADSRHRFLTHNAWFLYHVPERVFGRNRTNSDGRTYSVRSVCEQHVEEDYGGFIPTAEDFLQALEYQPWMDGRGTDAVPPSFERIEATKRVEKVIAFDER